MDDMELGQRLGRMDANITEGVHQRNEIMDDIREIKTTLARLGEEFSQHTHEDAETARRIVGIETTLSEIAATVKVLAADKERRQTQIETAAWLFSNAKVAVLAAFAGAVWFWSNRHEILAWFRANME